MSLLPKYALAPWLFVATGIAVSCSLQMPDEDEVFSADGGRRTGGGGASDPAQGGTSSGGVAAGGGPNTVDGGAPSGEGGEAGSRELGGSSGMTSNGGRGGPATAGAPDAGAPSGSGEGGEPSAGAGAGGTTHGGTTNGGVSGGGMSRGGTSSGGVSGSGMGGGGGAIFNPEDGLVAHYPFDEASGIVAANRKDITKNGTYYGACGHPTGRFGRAFSVRNQGSPDWVGLPEGVLSGLSATTLIVWVRDLSIDRKGGRVFDFGSGTAENIYFSPDQINPSNSLAGGHLGGTHLSLGLVDLWTTANLTDQNWHQVAVAWSAESIDLYVDAVLVGSKSEPRAVPSELGPTAPNWLGRSFNDVYVALYAEIDDLRIYNKVLSATELGLLYGLP